MSAISANKETRPKIVQSETYKITTTDECENLYITVGESDGRVIEVFITMGKSGGCNGCHNAALGISISEGLQHGVPLDVYVSALRGIRCPYPRMFPKDDRFLSCPDAVSGILAQYVNPPIGGLKNDVSGEG